MFPHNFSMMTWFLHLPRRSSATSSSCAPMPTFKRNEAQRLKPSLDPAMLKSLRNSLRHSLRKKAKKAWTKTSNSFKHVQTAFTGPDTPCRHDQTRTARALMASDTGVRNFQHTPCFILLCVGLLIGFSISCVVFIHCNLHDKPG